MYRQINNPRGNYKKKERFLKHENGSLIRTTDEQWGNYFGELLSSEEPEKTFNFYLENRDIKDWVELTLDEVKSQIKNLKNQSIINPL